MSGYCNVHCPSPWSRFRPEKLIFPLLMKKFPTFYRTHNLVHCAEGPTSCPCPAPDGPSPLPSSHFFNNHFDIILPSMLNTSVRFNLSILIPLCSVQLRFFKPLSISLLPVSNKRSAHLKTYD